jgi:hypothetical protein
MCVLMFKAHRPMLGALLTCPNRLSSFNSDRYLVLSGNCTCQPRLQTSHRLVDMSISIRIFYDGCCLELPVWSTCNLRLKLQKVPSPQWEVADVLAPTHACTTANASVNYSRYVPHSLESSHRRPQWEDADMPTSIRIDFWLYQGSVRASHACKLPIAPMGDSRFDPCLQGGGVYVSSGTVTIRSSSIYGNTAGKVRAHVQKFPLPPWETHVLLVVGRVVVSMSMEAQCQS